VTVLEPFAWRHVIGIVGGMGPLEHIEFERQLLVATRKRLGRPPTDQDSPEWIASSIPDTPDRTKALLGDGPPPDQLFQIRRARAARIVECCCHD
jgi:hypothetical protein